MTDCAHADPVIEGTHRATAAAAHKNRAGMGGVDMRISFDEQREYCLGWPYSATPR